MIKLVTKWTQIQDRADERLAICQECPSYNEPTTQCKECGCFMKAKTMFPNSVCPLGKWGKWEDDLTS